MIHIITNFSGVGGAELMLIRLIKALPRNKHTVISLMSISNDFKKELSTFDVSFYELKSRNMFDMFLCFFRLIPIIKKNSGTLFFWMYHACAVSPLVRFIEPKRKIYFNIRHSLDSYVNEKRSTKLAMYLSKVMSKYVDGVIYCSDNARVQHENYGFYPGNSIYIPNGYSFNDDYFPKCNNKEFFVIGMLGRFNEAKDFKNLLKSFKKTLSCYPDAFLKIGGKGVEHKNIELMKIIDNLDIPKDKLELLGPVTDVNSFYRSLDLYVLSSRNEAFPNVLVEAMSNSLPVVSTNVGDASLIINNNDYLVPPSDSENLSNKILEFIDMSEFERNSIGIRNKELVLSKYSIECISDMYLSLR